MIDIFILTNAIWQCVFQDLFFYVFVIHTPVYAILLFPFRMLETPSIIHHLVSASESEHIWAVSDANASGRKKVNRSQRI